MRFATKHPLTIVVKLPDKILKEGFAVASVMLYIARGKVTDEIADITYNQKKGCSIMPAYGRFEADEHQRAFYSGKLKTYPCHNKYQKEDGVYYVPDPYPQWIEV
jgi:hypothetical protein